MNKTAAQVRWEEGAEGDGEREGGRGKGYKRLGVIYKERFCRFGRKKAGGNFNSIQKLNSISNKRRQQRQK